MSYLVIKCGGSVLEELPPSFYENIIRLNKEKEWQPIIVHGGGPLISSLLQKLGIKTSFSNGLRVTTDEVLDVVEMVLSGSVNKQIVRQLVKAGGEAYGISGIDGGLLQAKPVANSEELGFVGEVIHVNQSIIKDIISKGYIPVISPIGIDYHGQRYNINGDMAASAVAKAFEAKLCMISNISGIYIDQNGEKQVLNQATNTEIEKLIQKGIIKGGMVPKVKAAIDGLIAKVPEVSIINGMEKNSLLDFAQGKEIGTKIILDEESQYVS